MIAFQWLVLKSGDWSFTLDLTELFLRLAHHIRLTGLALGLGVLIAVPLSVVAVRVRWLRGPLLGVVSVVQTVPSLALLALMVVVTGRIGFGPSLVALTAYALLPIARNTVTGLETADPDAVEAARGLGMTWWQTLWFVRLPLAMPVMVAGLRTATVWVVGTAVLATPVGEVSLGNYIFSGLQLSKHEMVLTGVVAAVGLALVLDGLVRLIEWGASARRWGVAWAGLGVLGAVLVGGTAPLWRVGAGDAKIAVIGGKTFTEQYVLQRVLADVLEDAGYEAVVREGLGSTVAFEALVAGEIDVYVDYSGTIWANQMKREGFPARDELLAEMTAWLEVEKGVRVAGTLGFENTYALAVTQETAAGLSSPTISALAVASPGMTLGGDYEFFDRPEWGRAREAYGLSFSDLVSMDSTLMYEACRSGAVDAISAFGTDGRIAAFELVVLEDDRGVFPPYDAVVLVSAGAARGVDEALASLDGVITIEMMREANRKVDVEGDSVANVASWLLERVLVGRSGTESETNR